MAFTEKGVQGKIISTTHGMIKSDNGEEVEVSDAFLTTSPYEFDAVFIAAGEESVDKLKVNKDALDFIDETYKHYKALGAVGEGVELLLAVGILATETGPGITASRDKDDIGNVADSFIQAVAEHRHWSRKV